MRRKLADSVILFNGKDGEFLAEILEANKNSVKVKIVKKTKEQGLEGRIELVYSPVKNVKDEFIVQKATELGVIEVHPCIFERTVKTKVNAGKLNLVAVEAAEQCERLDVPDIGELITFDKILESLKDKLVIFCDETGRGKPANGALQQVNNKNKIAVIIGPEGGFSSGEIDKIYSLPNVIGFGLGPRILRADTAVISALTLVQNYLGDFDKLPDFRGG